MSAFVEARHELVDDLQEAGINATAFVPGNVVPPLVFVRPVQSPVAPSDEGMTGTEYTYRVGLVIVTDANPEAEDALDVVEAALEEVIWNTDGWDVDSVDAPVVWNSGNGKFPAIALILSKTITIKGGS